MEIVDPFCAFDEYQFVSLQSFCFKLPTATPEHEVLTVKEIAVGDPAGLLLRRTDIASAERLLAAATAQIGVETANREAARLARLRCLKGEGSYLDELEVEQPDLASRRALTVARTNQRLAIISIYKALGGGWEICTQVDMDCNGTDGMPNLHVVK